MRFKEILRKTYLHFISVALIVLSAFLAVFKYRISFNRFCSSCVDLKNSVVFFFYKLFKNITDKPISVTDMPKIDLSELLPFDFSSVGEKFKGFWSVFWNKQNFNAYLVSIGPFLKKFLLISMVALPLLIGLKYVIDYFSCMPVKPEKRHKETLPLRLVKKTLEPVFLLVKRFFIEVIAFFHAHTLYTYLLGFIWAVNFNIVTIIFEFLAFYFYFVSSFHWGAIPKQILKLFIDFCIGAVNVNIIVFAIIIYNRYLNRRKVWASGVLQHHEMMNRGFIASQPIVTMNCGEMGSYKTTAMTDMVLSTSALFRHKALEILMSIDRKFPNFPFLKFEEDLKQGMEHHEVFNLASCKKYVAKKAYRFHKNPCRQKIWSYEFEKYAMDYDDDLKEKSLFAYLVDYAKAFFVYVINSSLVFSNYSVREDFVCNEGYFPIWSFNFFDRSSEASQMYSKYAHILNFDMLRLGKKMIEEDKQNGAFEFGIVAITEIGKERGNMLNNREFKRKDEECNPNNDLFNYSLKMARHRATICGFPFIRFFTDEQRPESWGADARDICSIIRTIDRSDEIRLYRGTILHQFIDDVISPKFEAYKVRMKNLGKTNTLRYYLAKNIISAFEAKTDRNVNHYSYINLEFEIESGRLNGKTKLHNYYLSIKKIRSDRFQTDCYGDLFDEISLSSGVGIVDILTYMDSKATKQELEMQRSYFYTDMTKWLPEEDAA